ncbi:MAG: tRNA uracil 4-sulfurtransferase ThiI [Halobacteria archaeon]|nr:tRNA uracil 4-sulfurtransferase ThiI [Halobacteria archaeon]
MIPPGADTVVVRYGEIGVKSPKVKIGMEKKLRRNLEEILAAREIEGEVEREWSRLFIRADEADIDRATDAATDTFGVVSASPSVTVPPDLSSITQTLASIAREAYTGGTFAVRARRAGKKEEHPFNSKDIEEEGGAAIWGEVEDEFEPEVDLNDPDLEFFVECREDEAYVFLEKRPGPGGLPLGTQSKLVALISGGYDSPVAAWEAMKRGCEVVPVYFDLGRYGGADHEMRAFDTIATLAEYAPGRDMRVRKVPAGDVMDRLVDHVDRGRMLVYRRFMYRVAEHVAERENAYGIVTGESIGQKSSQTSRNLGITSRATSLPVHRPLLTYDKQDIIDKSREIGTYAGSRIDAGCNRIAPDRPETNATLDRILEVEPDDLFEWAKEAAENVDVVELNAEPELEERAGRA